MNNPVIRLSANGFTGAAPLPPEDRTTEYWQMFYLVCSIKQETVNGLPGSIQSAASGYKRSPQPSKKYTKRAFCQTGKTVC